MGIFDYLDLDPKTVEAAQRLAEERGTAPQVSLAPTPPVPPAPPPQKSPEEMRELVKARYPGLSAVSERRNAGLPAYEKPLVDDATAGAAAKIGGAPFPWKDVGELDQGYAAERAKEPRKLSQSRGLARGGPVMDDPPVGHKEPFERSAEQAESAQARERKLQRTQGLQDIAEGLGNIDFRGVGSMIKIDPQKSYKAEGLRSLAKRQEDEMTPEERAAVEETSGVSFPEGTSWKNALKYMPSIASFRKTEHADETRDLKLDAALDKELREKVLSERANALSPSSRYGKLKDAVTATAQVESLLKQDNPVATRVAMVKIAKGLAGDTGVLTQQDIDAYSVRIGIPGFFTSAQNFVTGDFTPEQRQRMKEVAADLGMMAKEEFSREEKGRLDSFSEATRDLTARKGTSREDVAKMLNYGSGGGESAGGNGTVKMTRPDGTVDNVHPSKLEDYKKAHPDSKEGQ